MDEKRFDAFTRSIRNRIACQAYNVRIMATYGPQSSTTSAVRPDILTPQFLQALRDQGIVEAYLFGSLARGEERPDSDIDLFVVFAPSVRGLARLGDRDRLAEIAGRPVQLVSNLHPAFEPYIRPTLVPIPL